MTELVVGELVVPVDDLAQVLLDRELVLRGRRDDLRVEDRAVGVELVAVVEEATRRLGRAVADPGARLDLRRRRVRLLVLADQPQRLVAGVDELDAADDDAPEGVAAGDLEADLAGNLARERRQPVGAERVPSERAAEIRASVRATGMERVRALDMLLEEVPVVLFDADVEPAVGDDAPALDRVGTRLGECDQLALDGTLRKLEPGCPANRLQRGFTRPLERLDELAQLALPRRAVETADLHVHGMDLAAADDDHQLVARLLEGQSPLHDVGVLARHLHRPGVAEEVGRVEHVDVERVALDPLAAVEEPPQDPDRLAHLDPAEVLHRVDGAHLVRDRADAADPRGDVRRLEEGASAQERLEEARRLEDP